MKSPPARLMIVVAILFGFLWTDGYGAVPQPVRARHGMVVSGNRIASEVGLGILKKGGNAVDASVAVGFALAVVFPEAGNLGGGGYAVLRMHDGMSAGIDFRETAPALARPSHYLDSAGNITNKSLDGHRSVAVPGTVAGLLEMLERFGTMTREEVIRPSVELAAKGFVIDRHAADNFAAYDSVLRTFPSTMKVFGKDGHLPREGDTLVQPDLAETLERILKDGRREFYNGKTAGLIIREMEKGTGILSRQDLEAYHPVVTPVLRGSYRTVEILTMPPSTSGGICLLEALKILEGYDLARLGFHSSSSVHLFIETMKRVYADRSYYLGDPAFTDIPVRKLVSEQYAGTIRAEIDTLHATADSLIHPSPADQLPGKNTTNFVVADSSGSVVTTTYTINDLFGSKVVVDGAGFFLNDEMDDFSIKPDIPNIYGLTGGKANSIEPGKRPLSSITPAIVLRSGKPVMALGARGGARIITGVLETILNVIDFGMNIQEAVSAPRIHAQWGFPDVLYERFALPADAVHNLNAMGHPAKELPNYLSAVEALLIDQESGWIEGGPDPRESGAAAGY